MFTSLQSAKAGMTSVVNVMMPSQRIQKTVNLSQAKPTTDVDQQSKYDAGAPEDDQGLSETIIGKGIGNALKVFRERGMIGRDQHRGRTLDKTLE